MSITLRELLPYFRAMKDTMTDGGHEAFLALHKVTGQEGYGLYWDDVEHRYGIYPFPETLLEEKKEGEDMTFDEIDHVLEEYPELLAFMGDPRWNDNHYWITTVKGKGEA